MTFNVEGSDENNQYEVSQSAADDASPKTCSKECPPEPEIPEYEYEYYGNSEPKINPELEVIIHISLKNYYFNNIFMFRNFLPIMRILIPIEVVTILRRLKITTTRDNNLNNSRLQDNNSRLLGNNSSRLPDNNIRTRILTREVTKLLHLLLNKTGGNKTKAAAPQTKVRMTHIEKLSIQIISQHLQ